MRYLLLLTLFSVILFSLCAGLPEIPFINPGNTSVQKAGVLIIDSESPDVFIEVNAIPTEVKAGRNINVFFELRNKNLYDLKNISLTVYDPCIFTGDMGKYIDNIGANRTVSFSLKLTAGSTDLDKDCNVKFRVTYDAEYSLYQDIAVLAQSEYEQREVTGTLNNIPIQSSYPESPLKISVSFSDNQPLMENEKYYLHLDYRNVGSGIVNVGSSGITIKTPDNVKDFSCSGYDLTQACSGTSKPCNSFKDASSCDKQRGCLWHEHHVEGFCAGTSDDCIDFDISTCGHQIGCSWTQILSINRTLNFVGNRASSSTCSFTTTTTQEMDIKSLTITARYKYMLDNSILIKVKRA